MNGVNSIFPGRRIYDAGIANIKTEPDGCLLRDVSEVLRNLPLEESSLTVIHLFGSHYPFADRVPSGFGDMHFGTETKYRSYLNTILYSDGILENIFRQVVRLGNGPRVIIYISDHGEDVTGEVHRSEAFETMRAEFLEIPFAIWMSDEFAEQWPEKVVALRVNVSKLFINDYLYDSVLDLFEISGGDTVVYRNQQSIFNSLYCEPDASVRCCGEQYLLSNWLKSRM